MEGLLADEQIQLLMVQDKISGLVNVLGEVVEALHEELFRRSDSMELGSSGVMTPVLFVGL